MSLAKDTSFRRGQERRGGGEKILGTLSWYVKKKKKSFSSLTPAYVALLHPGRSDTRGWALQGCFRVDVAQIEDRG